MRIIFILFFSLFCSCKTENELEIHLKIEGYVNSQFESYEHIYKQVYIWLDEAKKLKLENTREIIFNEDYKVDKLLVINNHKTKLIGTVNFSHPSAKNRQHDWIFMFWGVKIADIWHFSRGGSLFVPRENYKYNIYETLNHGQLSYIGRDFFLNHFLKIDRDRISVDSKRLNDHVSLAKSSRFRDKSPIKNWLSFFRDKKNKKVSQKEIDNLRKNMRNEVEEAHTLPDPDTKEWKELYGGKIPLFERKEWKEYEESLKNK